MSDQRYPDGEFAKIAVHVAENVLFNLEKKDRKAVTREEYLRALAQATRALQGDLS